MEKKPSIRFFRLLLCIIAKNRKQPNCLSTREQINKLCYIYMKYYSRIKRNALMICAITRINKLIMLSE